MPNTPPRSPAAHARHATGSRPTALTGEPLLSKELANPHVTITPAVVIAFVQAAIGVAVAFSVNITTVQSTAVVALVTIVAAALLHTDSKVRAARLQAHATVHAARVHAVSKLAA